MMRVARRWHPIGSVVRAIFALVLLAGGARAAGTCDDGFGGRASCVSLSPRQPLHGEIAPIDGAPKLYHLAGLAPNTAYEFRVSYPATNPADIYITLVETRKKNSQKRTARKLLNVEKLVLSSKTIENEMAAYDASKRGDQMGEVTVRIYFKKYGVHRDGHGKGFKNVVYNVVLEPMVDRFGLIPKQAAPVGVLAILCVVLAIYFSANVQRLIWLTSGTRRKVR
tara:strand:- start:1179 stop:1850 length:672 start_codon:yes stop_codon:yes gene_type:complete